MHSKSTNVRAWIKGSCSGIGYSNDRPIPVYDNIIHIGNHTIHHTHKVYTISNLFYCSKCGCHVNKKMKKLKDPCTNVRTEAGQLFLDQLNSGNFITSDLASSTFHNIQSDIDNMILEVEDEVISNEGRDSGISSEDGQSSLGIPESLATSDSD